VPTDALERPCWTNRSPAPKINPDRGDRSQELVLAPEPSAPLTSPYPKEVLMHPYPRRVHPLGRGIVLLLAGALLTACGDSDTPQASKPAMAPKPTAAAPAPAKADIPAVNACSLLSAAEVESAAGRETTDPVEDHTAERMSICAFGEPGSPMVAGKPLSRVAVLTVVTGGNDYFAGPEAQVNAIFDMAGKNAGELEVVSGLGERAHWAPLLNTLRAVRGAYMVEVEVAERDREGNKVADPRKIAEQLGKIALARIP
jgi:hypothetical protein